MQALLGCISLAVLEHALELRQHHSLALLTGVGTHHMTSVCMNEAMEVVVEAVDGLALGFVVERRKGGASSVSLAC